MRPLLLIPLTAVLLAQTPGDDGGDVVFRSETRRVLLHVSVTDKAGKMITSIPQSAFKVTENGVEQRIRYFQREDVPLSLGLIIDNSGSMRNKLAQVNAAALALVKASNPQDEVFIYNFNDEIYRDQDFTSDVRLLEKALAKIDTRGGTALRNAVSMGLDHVRKGTKAKKVLVVITDGADTSSVETTQEQLLRKAHNSEVLIYCIGILGEEKTSDRRAAKKVLKSLAEASGGLDFYPDDVSQVLSITPGIAEEIRNQYLVEYAPSNQALDGTFRQIKVTLSGVRGANVRTRSGYWATPQPAAQASLR